MQAINDYVIVDIIKKGPKKVGGLILTDETDESNRYRKANIVSVGNMVEIVTKGDIIYYDGVAGHDIAYNDKFINPKLNNVFVPIKNLLGLFETYVYTKPNFDPAPRIMQECKYFGKKFIYLRDHNIKDGGPVYYKRPATCLTDPVNKPNIEVMIKAINDII